MWWTSVRVQHRWLLIAVSEYISDIHLIFQRRSELFSVNVRDINIYRVLCFLTKKKSPNRLSTDTFTLTPSLNTLAALNGSWAKMGNFCLCTYNFYFFIFWLLCMLLYANILFA